MTQKQHQLSAKDFRDPLLHVLGDLTSNKPFSPIDCKATYPYVCARMEITADQFGEQESSGKLWVHLWIGWAFRSMKKSGCTNQKSIMFDMPKSVAREIRSLRFSRVESRPYPHTIGMSRRLCPKLV